MSSFELTPNNTHALQKETLTCELQKEKSGLQHLVVGEVAIERGPWCGARTRLRWPCRHLRCCCAVVVQRIGVGRGRWLEPCVLSCGSAAEDGSREVGDHRGCGADAKLQTELPKTNLKNWRAPHCIGARRGPHFTHRRAASRPFVLAGREAGGHVSGDPVPGGGRRRRGWPASGRGRRGGPRGSSRAVDFGPSSERKEPMDLTGSGSRRCGIGKISPDLAHRGTASPRRAARIAWAAPKRTSRWLRGGVVAH